LGMVGTVKALPASKSFHIFDTMPIYPCDRLSIILYEYILHV
jgi:hypothetical protein